MSNVIGIEVTFRAPGVTGVIKELVNGVTSSIKAKQIIQSKYSNKAKITSTKTIRS
ncbi:MAG: hypothetical protein H8E72_07450 [Candidatus Marinimicrobia bacterium]|nr:hypothetical protein [Candidatus Neomarinimicrobiota bacterium]